MHLGSKFNFSLVSLPLNEKSELWALSISQMVREWNENINTKNIIWKVKIIMLLCYSWIFSQYLLHPLLMMNTY